MQSELWQQIVCIKTEEELNGNGHVPLFHLFRVKHDLAMNVKMPHNFY